MRKAKPGKKEAVEGVFCSIKVGILFGKSESCTSLRECGVNIEIRVDFLGCRPKIRP